MLKKYIGNKQFYKAVLILALPIMLQNGITNFVGMLDNIMIGKVGTLEMTGVANANQLIFVFNLALFGALSGIGIFGAQYAGKGDTDGLRHSMRLKLMVSLALSAVAVAIFALNGQELISLYLKGEGEVADKGAALGFGFRYMLIMLIGLAPYSFSQAYSSTLRESGEAVVPMLAGTAAVLTNLGLNYVLIYGRLGAPKLGIEGAAIATVISRFIELLIVVLYTHLNTHKHQYARGLYSSFFVPSRLLKQVALRGTPLLINETLWSSGMAILNQFYSTRGLNVMASVNIMTSLWNVVSVSFMAFGTAAGIIAGQKLGAGDNEGAKDSARKLTVFSVAVSLVFAFVYVALAEVFPNIYETTNEVKALAGSLIMVGAVAMPFCSFTHCSYFILRAGGKSLITFIFDSGFVWTVAVPFMFVLSKYTSLGVIPLYAICQSLEAVKCVIGYIFMKKGVWINKMV